MAINIEEIKHLIKNTFPDSKPFETELIVTTKMKFWKEIQLGLDYRGNNSEGMDLNEEQETELKIIQEEYKTGIRAKIKADSKFYFYPSVEGIPGYVVMWDFSVIYNNDKNWFFVYGSASD